MLALFIPAILGALTTLFGLWGIRRDAHVTNRVFWSLLGSTFISVVITTATMAPLWVAVAPLLPLALFLAIAYYLSSRVE